MHPHAHKSQNRSPAPLLTALARSGRAVGGWKLLCCSREEQQQQQQLIHVGCSLLLLLLACHL
eukprot:54814-Prymnesium_polylepis.1